MTTDGIMVGAALLLGISMVVAGVAIMLGRVKRG